MPDQYQIHVFISHSWSYTEHYKKLAEWIFDDNWNVEGTPIKFLDYSVPRNDPIHNAPTDKKLREAIFDKIGRSHVVVIPTGMYATHSDWIQEEIDGSQHHSKPIVGVNPWGQERTSKVVAAHAREVVGWQKKSVIDAVWRQYRK